MRRSVDRTELRATLASAVLVALGILGGTGITGGAGSIDPGIRRIPTDSGSLTSDPVQLVHREIADGVQPVIRPVEGRLLRIHEHRSGATGWFADRAPTVSIGCRAHPAESRRGSGEGARAVSSRAPPFPAIS